MFNFTWLFLMIPCGSLFAGIAIFAWQLDKPMWFLPGREMKASELTDVYAYNKANALMWLIYSVPYWVSGFLGLINGGVAGVLLVAALLVGLPVLVLIHRKIREHFHVKAPETAAETLTADESIDEDDEDRDEIIEDCGPN